MKLRPDQIERYSRHILLRGVGGGGQKRLLQARIELSGGRIAGWALSYLVAAGVGRIALESWPGPPLAGLEDANDLNPDCQLTVGDSLETPSLLVDAGCSTESAQAMTTRSIAGQIPLLVAVCGDQSGWVAPLSPWLGGCRFCLPRPFGEPSGDPISAALFGSSVALLAIQLLLGQPTTALSIDGHRSQLAPCLPQPEHPCAQCGGG